MELREGEAPAEPRFTRNQTTSAAQQELRPPVWQQLRPPELIDIATSTTSPPPAEVPHRVAPAQATVDVKDGVPLLKDTHVVTAAGFAGNEDGAERRDADLAAVVVASEDEVELVFHRPGELIRAVDQSQPEVLVVFKRSHIGNRFIPRSFVASDDDGNAARNSAFTEMPLKTWKPSSRMELRTRSNS